jgi:hypothetical protein
MGGAAVTAFLSHLASAEREISGSAETPLRELRADCQQLIDDS